MLLPNKVIMRNKSNDNAYQKHRTCQPCRNIPVRAVDAVEDVLLGMLPDNNALSACGWRPLLFPVTSLRQSTSCERYNGCGSRVQSPKQCCIMA